jgi:hypothetical protein
MIPEEHKTAVISNGLHFMRSITEAYGAEEGLKLWDTIASTLDGDVKGQIFLAMITGTYNNRVHLKGLGRSARDNAVACIKEIRLWSGLGLKESKDMYDRLRNRDFDSSPSQEFVNVKHEDYHKAVAGLRNAGFTL